MAVHQPLEEKVKDLENAIRELVYLQHKNEMQIGQLTLEMKAFKDEMLAFKDEMKDFKDEMKAFKDEMLVFKDEMKAFKDEMKDFKDEMLDFKDEMKDFKDEMLSFKDEMKGFKDEMKHFKDEMKVFKDEILIFKYGVETFKDEMKGFKDEMLAFKDEMQEFKDEMKAFKDEMKEFKDEMQAFKDELRDENRRMNKRWGEISNKLGTLVEDIVAPAIDPMIEKYFGMEPIETSIRVRRRKGNLKAEFDAVAICEHCVFLFEVKSTPRKDYIKEFFELQIPRFKQLYPEYASKKLYPVFASLRIEQPEVDFCTENGIYAMAYREWDYMDLLNYEELEPQRRA